MQIENAADGPPLTCLSQRPRSDHSSICHVPYASCKGLWEGTILTGEIRNGIIKIIFVMNPKAEFQGEGYDKGI